MDASKKQFENDCKTVIGLAINDIFVRAYLSINQYIKSLFALYSKTFLLNILSF